MTGHDGHRQRMRERFRMEGLDGFAVHEVLELLLFYSRARGNVNPLAHDLLDAFGSLKGVLEARPEQLMTVKGVGEESATLLSMIVPLFRKYQESICQEQKSLKNRRAAEEYCRALLEGLRTERFYVISMSSTMKVLGRRIVGEGSLTEVPAYPRLVVETALNHNAYGVVLCHNHPGGDATPSPDDIMATRNIQSMLAQLGILVLDHVIVSGGQVHSMLLHGELPMPENMMDPNCHEDVQLSGWLDERTHDA